eukprot:GGOE01049614.1.p1 GENE.GGOE01049614.1~~GGOE01049614.1.p1  ORF type:complete len:540 (+),score=142.95 GGOE01049614.1:133-1752(+)
MAEVVLPSSRQKAILAPWDHKWQSGAAVEEAGARQAPSLAGKKVDKSKEVTIHVYDEVNGLSQDFLCLREAVLRSMRYFRAHISENGSWDDFDITVHCDVHVFHWLVTYIHATEKPLLEVKVAVSILISSHFLQMEDLVEIALQYIATHLQDVLRLPIDFSCITEPLMKKLASLLAVEELDELRDRKERLLPHLFLFKLRDLLDGPTGESLLQRCRLCSGLLVVGSRLPSFCPKAPVTIDRWGRLQADHVGDKEWDVTAYLLQLRRLPLSWTEVYWRIWALLTECFCEVCQAWFPMARFGHCLHHPTDPVLPAGGGAVPIYGCCNTEVPGFGAYGVPQPTGCQARNHTISVWPGAADSKAALVAKQRMSFPAIAKKHPQALIPVVPAPTVALSANHNSDVVPRGGSAAQEEEVRTEDSSSDSSEERCMPPGGNRGDGARQPPGKSPGLGLGLPSKPSALRMKKQEAWWSALSPEKRSLWLTSRQRENDQRRMERLVDDLLKKRADPVQAKLGAGGRGGRGMGRRVATMPGTKNRSVSMK